MSTLSVNNITTQTGSTITIPSGKTLIAPGHVLQSVRVSRNSTSHETFSSTSLATSTLTLSITPKASGNKILVQCTIGVGNCGGGAYSNTALYIDGSNVSATNGGSAYFWAGYWDNSNSDHGGTGYYEYTTVDTNAHTFALYCSVSAGGSSFHLHKGASHSLICTEIAT